MKYTLVFLLILFTQSIQAQWIQQNSGTSVNLYHIKFLNSQTGWAVGDAGIVIKTTNGGTNWINVPNPSNQYGGLLWSVWPADSNVVYVVAGYDFIMKTNNGGANWNVISARPGSISNFSALYFLNKDTGWFLGTNKVFRTYNGAQTLDSFYAPWFTNTDIYFKDINNGVFCGTGRAFRSTDRGETWIDAELPVGGQFPFFRRLGYYDNNIWLGASSSKIYKSTNIGLSWIISDSSHGAEGIFFIDSISGFIGGGLNRVYKTTNGGINFYRQKTDTNSLAFVSAIDFTDENTGWYCCAVGRIYKTTTGGEWLTNTNNELEEFVPSEISLKQNYPNPFNPVTTIEYTINTIGYVEIEVYDILGNKISSEVNSYKSSGTHKYIFNAKGMASGTYLYFLKVNNRVENARKMIILK